MHLLSWTVFLAIGVHALKDVSRINQGVEFQYLRSVRPVVTHWYHSFIIPIPDNPLDQQEEILLGTRLNQSQSAWLLDCLNRHDRSSGSTNVSFVPAASNNISASGAPRSFCHTLNEEFGHLGEVVQHNYALVSAKYQAIRGLLPAPISLNQGRKRGLIDAVGRAANSLFGVATDQQLKAVVNHVKKFSELAARDIKVVKETLQDLSSFSSAADNRITKLVEAVRRSSNQILERHRSQTAVSTYRIEFLRKSTEINHSAWTLAVHLESFLLGMSMLSVGKLPIELIDRELLLNEMREIQTHVRTHIDPRLRLIKNGPWDYYKSSNFVYSYAKEHLIVTLDFPLTIFEEEFDIYQVLTLPLAVSNLPNGTMILKSDVHAVAFHQSKEYYFTLTDVEIATIKLSADHSTDVHVLHKITSEHCLSAIFYEWPEAVKQVCHYQIVVHRQKFSDISYLGNHKFLLFNIPLYNITCNESYSEISFEGCGHCVVTLQSGCTLSTPGLIALSPEKDSRPIPDDQNTSIHSFTVNRPLLSHFFTEEDLHAIRGDTLLVSPPRVQLPNLTMFQHPSEDLIAQDELLRLDMRKTVETMKRNAMVLHSKADSMQYDQSIQALESHNLFGDYADFVSIAMMCCGGLMLAVMMRMWILIRTLTASLTLLAAVPKVKASPLVLSYTLPPVSFSTPNSSLSSPFVDFLSSIHESPPTLVYLSTLMLIIALILCNVGYLLSHRFRSVKIETVVALSFSAADGSALIEILKIYDLPSSLQMCAADFVNRVQVVSGIRPLLTYRWDAVVENVTSCSTVPVCTRVPISWRQYIKLRRMLTGPYTVIPVFLHNALLHPVVLRKSDSCLLTPGVSLKAESSVLEMESTE